MEELMAIFLIMGLGLFIGNINFFGVKFGASAIIFVSLVFGHFGVELSPVLSGLGLVMFLAPIGLMAGSNFLSNIKENGLSFLLIAFLTTAIGGLTIAIAVMFFGIPADLALGLASGALTSTAMLGSVNSLTGSALPGVGYGIAYVFGVLGVVLFVQLIPKILNANVSEENEKLVLPDSGGIGSSFNVERLRKIDNNGLFPVACAIVLGVLLGSIEIPVGASVNISLGNGGGALIAGIILGHFGRIGNISFTFPKEKLQVIRDLGLAFFLMRAGVNAGAGFIEVLGQYGIKLFFIGAFMTLVPATISFLIAYNVFKLPLFAALGTTTGSMTSAPSLGALLTVTEDDKVSSFYAATQPVATVLLVFLPQIINIFFKIN